WHLDYLASLGNVDVYHFSGAESVRLGMRIGRPDVPRVETTVNGRKSVSAIIDSGAVLSIVSRNLASELPVRMLGTFEGTFAALRSAAQSIGASGSPSSSTQAQKSRSSMRSI